MNAPFSRRQALSALMGAGAIRSLSAESEPAKVLRFGLSDSLRGDVNVSDARSAMAVWFKRIEQDMKVVLRYDPNIFEDIAILANRLKQGQLDAVGINIFEYRRLLAWLDPDQVTVPVQKTSLQYQLLVRDAGISRLADLKGRRLTVLDTPPTCVALAWLSSLLSAEGLDSPQIFFSSLVKKTKPTQAVLPVFFGQAEACLTTKASFLTMGELNPQVSLKLRPLATSPELVTTLYAYRRDWKGLDRDLITRALEDLRSSPGGRQILTMFQSDRLVASKSSCLDSALAILARAERAAARKGGSE